MLLTCWAVAPSSHCEASTSAQSLINIWSATHQSFSLQQQQPDQFDYLNHPRNNMGGATVLTSSGSSSSSSLIFMDFPSLPISKGKAAKRKRKSHAAPALQALKFTLPTYVILNAFTCFPKLPTELRLRIWDSASFLPRDLDVWVKSIANLLGCQIFTETYKFHSAHLAPAILHTSHEARVQGLKHYRLAFGVDFMDEPLRVSTLPRIYLNPYSDRVCFLGTMVGKSSEEIRKMIRTYKIRYLTINVEENHEDYAMDHWKLRLLDQRGKSSRRPWLNGDIKTITLYYHYEKIHFGQKFSFIDLNEEEIRGRQGLEVIHIPEYRRRELEPSQQMFWTGGEG
ncbi:hypothetical protein DL98DRAFT_643998 [Cadophora sp. DSE1049]|nr:hypothetical protein DL98DRAFT_643998 [Cadophora sp. DSE1049]